MSNPQTLPSAHPSSSNPIPNSFTFPPAYSFPPFFTLQPNLSTRRSQLQKWSRLIQRWARQHSLFKLSLDSALDTPLFRNSALRKRLSASDGRLVVDWMASAEGGMRAEWVGGQGAGGSGKREGGGMFWVFWRREEEWGELVREWVEETGQRGVILTFWELREGEGARGREWWGMDRELFARCLETVVKRRKAQVFGGEGEEGVKFL